jgi:hypothetical protein
VNLLEYLCAIFSSSNVASFSRWATACTVLTGCWAVIHLTRINHALPGPADLAALAFWMTSPYGINKIAGAWLEDKRAGKPGA